MRNFIYEWNKPWVKKESYFQKRRRSAIIVSRLKKSYPHAGIELIYGNNVQLLIAVILSAQCTDKKVNEVTKSLFKKYKTAKAFANADLADIEKLIRPTGFFRTKAKNIISACKTIMVNFGGKIPRTMEEILTLRGVARKTANVVLGNAFGVVEGIAVDTHVRRLSQRLALSKEHDPVAIEHDLMAIVLQRDWFPLTYLLISHGRRVCGAQKPQCASCPLKAHCPSSRI